MGTAEEVTLVEKVVKYGMFAWKLAIPCIDEDENEDEDEEVTVCDECEITNVIPIDENPEHNIRITWVCSIERTDVVDSGGDEYTNIKTAVGRTSCTEAIIRGVSKISIIDKDGAMLPGTYNYFAVDSEEGDEDHIVKGVIFTELDIPNDPDEPYFVLFELNIALDETEALEYRRFTNDLCVLFDESLLTDSVLRVSGREFSVHRAVLAARWPRFYVKYLIESKNSVVDVGDVEPEAFEKLLRCIYSNTIPTSLLKEDILCQDLVQNSGTSVAEGEKYI